MTDNLVAPHRGRPQPLSHGATRRDSSPFRGAEGWEEVVTLYASVYHDAATSVSLLPVRGGVLDAPRWCDRRAALDASVWPDQLHPRHLRRACLRHPPHASKSRGHSPRTIGTGEPTLSVDRGREGVEALPYGVSGEVCARNRRRPSSDGGASGTPPLTGGRKTTASASW